MRARQCIGMLVVVAGMLMSGLVGGAGAEGMLVIQTDPGDARIYINGQRKDTSPSDLGHMFAIKLEVGEYVVEAMTGPDEEIGKYGVQGDIYLADGSKQTVSLKLGETVGNAGPALREQLKKQYPSDVPVPKVVDIPGGTFVMGCEGGKSCDSDEKPAHRVTMPDFVMGATEVTFAQWDACVAYGGCDAYPSDEGWGRGDRPVINVSWEDAQKYIQWLNGVTRRIWRLPTEAEWEYAARAGSTTVYSWGNSVGTGNANCDGCGSQWDDSKTAPVGSFNPNAWGLYDMHGNVWEWCQDWYDESYYSLSPAQNPQGPSTGHCRVIRGGSWYSMPVHIRSADREYPPSFRNYVLGFRLLRTE